MPSERSAERLVLVVDDDPDILQTLALCLSTEGYRVLMAANGREALDLLSRERPACILLDLMMPVMDGWQFREEQIRRAELAEIPVIVVSAVGKDRIDKIDADAYLSKPVDLEKLLERVTEYCRPA